MELGTRIAGRYRVEARLGRGGMGTVYRVHDEVSRSEVALKLMSSEAAPSSTRSATLFEREYHALAELAHPRIISVHDYGVADGIPYYTMELLDGRDLRECAPLPWRRACALLRDVCSSLAILHSRRIVHRDLSPRNVRCTEDGRAKLIDFGAMSPMGATEQIVGTAGYMAPEVLLGPEVDGRADLFSLGALAYWTLTARHAYPVKVIAELRSAWRTPPPVPSLVAPEIPRELDELVMTMMSMERLERPQSAAEVIDRLTAIAVLDPPEQMEIQAYLHTPTLVGRDEPRERFTRRLNRAKRGRGSTLMVEGESGTGRTRLLGTFVSEARAAGALAVRVAADEIEGGSFVLWRGFARALREHAPEIARDTAAAQRGVLARVLPELFATTPDTASAEEPTREAVRFGLVAWMLEVARHRLLVLAVDDLDDCDRESLAALAHLAHEAGRHPLIVVASAPPREDGIQSAALARIAATGGHVTLQPLSREQSGSLVASVFGATSHLEVVASWIYGLARGNPERTMELAQFLVDQGVARFSEGSWTLPEHLRNQDLPRDMEEAMAARLSGLSAAAAELGQLLSLVTPHGPLTFSDTLVLLSDRFEPGALFAALEELTLAQMVVRQGHALRGDAWRGVFERRMNAVTRRALHERLAGFYERQGGHKLLQAHHRAQAGRWQDAIECLIAVGREELIQDVASPDAVFARSRYGVELMEQAIEEGARLGHPASLAMLLRRSLLGVAASARPELVRHAAPQLAQLQRDSGLVYLDALDPALTTEERLVECLRRAHKARDAAAPQQRGLRPERAMREMAMLSSLLLGVYVRVLDSRSLLALPDLVAPLAPISRAADVLHRVACLTRDAFVSGADVGDRRFALRDELSGRLDGVDDVLRQGVYHLFSFYCGIEHAMHGDARALDVADGLPTTGTHAVLPWQVRKLYFQSVGERGRMELCRRELEVLAVGHVEAETHLTVSLVFELGIAATSADLMEVKRLWRACEREAGLYPGWRPVERLARALYALLRRDLDTAERAAREGLALVNPLEHMASLPLSSCLVDVLVRTSRSAEALRVASEALAGFRRQGLVVPAGPFPSIQIPMAFAEAGLDLQEEAAARLDALIESFGNRVESYVPRGVAHEERARLALVQGDKAAFELHAERAAEVYRTSRMPSLARRHATLMAAARQLDPDCRSDVGSAVHPRVSEGVDASTATSLYAVTAGRASRSPAR